MPEERGPASAEASLAASGLGLAAGSLFADRYLIEALLGRGGMGAVWRARDQLVGELVALKVLTRPSGPTAALAADLFRREVRLSRRVTHPHVVRIHDLGELGGALYLTMELVQGHDLRRELERLQKLSVPAAASMAAAVASGLEAAHAAGIVHRDLKPENVLLERTGRVLVTDFGIARAVSGEENAARTVGLVGTPLYMSPEQLEGTTVGPAADVYSLGLVLFETVVGAPAFSGPTPFAIAAARMTGPAPDPRSRADVPDAIAELILACLAREPQHRPSAAELAASLREHAVGGLGPGWPSRATRRLTSAPADLPGDALTELPQRMPQMIAESDTILAGSRTAAGIGAPARESHTTGRRGLSPLVAGDTSLAVLPFTYRGPGEHDWLGEAISGELIDTLSRTRGLRVLGAGAVTRAIGDRDPRRICGELEVDAVVDGSAQIAGSRVRVAVRLLDAEGTQRWSERFDLELGDLLVLQETAARRITEALRLEVTTFEASHAAPPGAIERYLRARAILRAQIFARAHEAVALLEEALAEAPDFGAAQAVHALACVLVWFYPSEAPPRDWGAEAEASVARALAIAPDAAESHLAAARFHSHRGELGEAVAQLRLALAIAPTSVDVHNLCGQLECETGRVDEGLARLAQAQELEPSASTYPYERARVAALAGDRATFDACMERVDRLSPGMAPAHLALREAAWSREPARLAAAMRRADASVPALAPFMNVIARGHLGEVSPAEVATQLQPLLGLPINLRLRAIVTQCLVEVQAAAGAVEDAVATLRQLDRTLLYDVTWLDRCTLLDSLRTSEGFLEVVRATRIRCDRVWANARAGT